MAINREEKDYKLPPEVLAEIAKTWQAAKKILNEIKNKSENGRRSHEEK